MVPKNDLKEKLLSSNYYIDNDFLNEYIDLIYSVQNLSGYTEIHHIQPRSYFKLTNQVLDDSEDNKVRLTYSNHCKAHWLLYFCTIGQLKQANATAVSYIQRVYKKLTNEHKIEFSQVDFDLLQKYMDDICNDESSKYWSTNEIAYLIEHYDGYGSGPSCAKYLGKTIRQVNEKARLLNLTTAAPDWTEAELQILRQYYPLGSQKVYKQLPNRTPGAIRAKAKELNIQVETHYWTEKDIELFKQHAGEPLTEIVKLFPGRTYASIKHYWQRHIKKEYTKNDKNNDRRKN